MLVAIGFVAVKLSVAVVGIFYVVGLEGTVYSVAYCLGY